ncbi:MAG TPA: HupE/UreJ family protein [Gammaproteobacteria bacterium]|nr:HupE/UreJ family protein [Gammaproteobacteria bacterium]
MRLLVLVLGVIVSPVAWSHGVHATQPGFIGGVLHPITAIDHVLAAAGMGLWLGLQRFTRMSPPLYGSALAAGIALAIAAGGMVTDIEWLLAGTLIITGLLLYKSLQLPQSAVASTVTMIFSCHFYAHIAEMPAALNRADTTAYIVGFFAGSALMITVAALASAGHGARLWVRVSGAVIAVAGAAALGLA